MRSAPVELSMPSWSEVQSALQMDFSQVLPCLRDLEPKGLWPLFLSYHLFSDKTVWKDGRHTTVSWTRSRVVWQSISGAVAALAKHDHSAVRVVRALLEATKGPRHEKLDPREPYRHELAETLWQMESKSAALLKDYYSELATTHRCPHGAGLSGSEWLLSTEHAACSDFHSPAHSALGPAKLSEPDRDQLRMGMGRWEWVDGGAAAGGGGPN